MGVEREPLGIWVLCRPEGVPWTRLCLPQKVHETQAGRRAEKQEDEAVDVTPVMICVFVVMCCSMLVLLYHFYDQLGAPPPLVPGRPRPRPPAHGEEPRCLVVGWREPEGGALGPGLCLPFTL